MQRGLKVSFNEGGRRGELIRLNAKRIESWNIECIKTIILCRLNAKRIESPDLPRNQNQPRIDVSMQRGRSEEGQSSCAQACRNSLI